MLNEQSVIGYLGKDPELKMTPGGKSMCVINVAATEKWKNQDGSPGEHTEWFRCIFWGPQAENAEKFLKKGSLVYIKGSTKTRKYDKDGVEQKITEVQGQIFRALRDPGTGGGHSSNSGGGKKEDNPDPAGYSAPTGGGTYDDDIPFN